MWTGSEVAGRRYRYLGRRFEAQLLDYLTRQPVQQAAGQQAPTLAAVKNTSYPVALQDGKPAVHSHLAIGHPAGRVEGGHLTEAYVFPTVELFLMVYPTPLYKKADPETDLHLIDPAARQ